MRTRYQGLSLLVTLSLVGGLLITMTSLVGAQPTSQDLEATIEALQTQVPVLQTAEAEATHANTTLTINPSDWVTKDGKPMSIDQIAHDKPLWDAVMDALKTLDEETAYRGCGGGMMKTTLLDTFRANGEINDEAWVWFENHAYLMSGNWEPMRDDIGEAIARALQEAIGQPPPWAPLKAPTVKEELQHMDEQYPGCSTGQYWGAIP